MPLVTLKKLSQGLLPQFATWRADNRECFSPSKHAWGVKEWTDWYWDVHQPDTSSHMFSIWAKEPSRPDTPVGAIGFNSRTREVHGVVIDWPWRGKGILRDAFPHLYYGFGPGPVNLVVRAGNDGALRAYQRLGFEHKELTPSGHYRMARYVSETDCNPSKEIHA